MNFCGESTFHKLQLKVIRAVKNILEKIMCNQSLKSQHRQLNKLDLTIFSI